MKVSGFLVLAKSKGRGGGGREGNLAAGGRRGRHLFVSVSRLFERRVSSFPPRFFLAFLSPVVSFWTLFLILFINS